MPKQLGLVWRRRRHSVKATEAQAAALKARATAAGGKHAEAAGAGEN
jgi:hypothetical protein